MSRKNNNEAQPTNNAPIAGADPSALFAGALADLQASLQGATSAEKATPSEKPTPAEEPSAEITEGGPAINLKDAKKHLDAYREYVAHHAEKEAEKEALEALTAPLASMSEEARSAISATIATLQNQKTAIVAWEKANPAPTYDSLRIISQYLAILIDRKKAELDALEDELSEVADAVEEMEAEAMARINPAEAD